MLSTQNPNVSKVMRYFLTLGPQSLNRPRPTMIRVHRLSKYYASKRALGPVDFEIEDGESVGFLGLNGAGKTTALRILACDLRPSGGSVTVDKVDALANPHEVRKRIGFLPETAPVYLDMTVNDYLDFAGRLRGMTKSEVRKRKPKVLDTTDLGDVQSRLIGHLSHGYRQRVGVAQAIIHDPQLLILDEPTRGLDPVQIVEMRKMIQQLKESHTILISSHILTEISQTCDRLLVLGEGRIIASGDEEDLSGELLDTKGLVVAVRAETDDDAAQVITILEGIEGVEDVGEVAGERGARAFELSCTEDARGSVAKALVDAGHELIKLDRSNTELESIFLNLVEGGAHGRN